MQQSAIFVSVFSILAAVLSFQLLIESSILHERARNRRIIDAALKEKGESPDEKKDWVCHVLIKDILHMHKNNTILQRKWSQYFPGCGSGGNLRR